MDLFRIFDNYANKLGTKIGQGLAEVLPTYIIVLAFIIPIVALIVWIW